MSRYDYFDYPAYVPVAQRAAQNRDAVAKMRKRNPDIRPVVIEGRTIASSWWGKSWNQNLERYADYSNRIGRGRSYVRYGAVLDLQVSPGEVHALVQGSSSKPYKIAITIKELSPAVWEGLRECSLDQIDTLGALLAGKFPKELKDTFFAQGTGLFPTPAEIDFDCSCPDWASMCKHVAAVLYGVGNRLDESPELLFTLRGVSMDDLIAKTLDTTTANLIDRAELVADGDVLADADLGNVFGIELEDADLPVVELPPVEPAKPRKSAGKTKPTARKTAKASTKKPARSRKAAPKPKVINDKPVHGQMVVQFVEAVKLLPKTFGVAEAQKLLANWDGQQVTNTLQRAVREKLIARMEPGKYRLP